MEEELIIVRYSEIALKSQPIRSLFEKKLIQNIKNALKVENIENKIIKTRGRIYIYSSELVKTQKVLTKIFGIISYSIATKSESDIEDIVSTALMIAKNKIQKNNSFALRVTRTGNHPYTSQEIAIKAGDVIRKNTKASVKLDRPDVELFIEIRDENSYFFTEKKPGPGGLPRGTQGKILGLVDSDESILACWYLLRRGCSIVFLLTDKKLQETLENFIQAWYANKKIYVIDEKKDFYKKLNEIKIKEQVNAICMREKHYDYKIIKKTKTKMAIPVLTPLISFEQKTINKKLKEIGIRG